MNNWHHVWEKKRHEEAPNPTLTDLLHENGYDILGAVTEANWRSYLRLIGKRLSLQPGDSVFDVGCGTGAFLWAMREAGHPVGGLDYSSRQITRARQAMPEVADFSVGQASDLPPDPAYACVVASGTFLYFENLEYAEEVAGRMNAKATKCLAILDLPDLAQKETILRARKEAVGAEAYEKRYAGLDHLYFSRDWVRQVLERMGLKCAVEDQVLPSYQHSPFRFNAFAWKT